MVGHKQLCCILTPLSYHLNLFLYIAIKYVERAFIPIHYRISEQG